MKALLTLLIIGNFLYSSDCFAQAEQALRRRNFNHVDGIALREFDPVSYFKGKPAKGDPKIHYAYKGIEYNFVSTENMEEFKKAPTKYEPAYGGWCAYSMATRKQVKVDPLTYKIINGKLYLFSNFGGNNTLLKWNKDEKKLKEAADRYWLSLN